MKERMTKMGRRYLGELLVGKPDILRDGYRAPNGDLVVLTVGYRMHGCLGPVQRWLVRFRKDVVMFKEKFPGGCSLFLAKAEAAMEAAYGDCTGDRFKSRNPDPRLREPPWRPKVPDELRTGYGGGKLPDEPTPNFVDGESATHPRACRCAVCVP